jgi:uncharacterized protein with NRDE domain
VCTLAVAWRAFDGAPVVVAANRDEALDRPAEPPACRSFGGTAAVAPRDARADGTWIGYNEHGLFVGVTNRWDVGVEGERSRGRLVADALAERSARAARETVERAVERDEYAGFELVAAGTDGAALLEWDGRLRTRPLAPGVSVVVNVGAALADGTTFALDAGADERRRAQVASARRLRERLAVRAAEGVEEWFDRAAGALGDHGSGACVHGDGFGTRSSSLLAPGRSPAYRFADGPPCETPYRTVDEQV